MKNNYIDNNNTGKRDYRRIPEKHMVLIQTCDSIGTVTGNFAEHALTLDYGQGGLRIVIDREIPFDKLLRIDFGSDFVVPQLQGIVKVCWHRELENRPKVIEAGLAFQDHFSQAVLAIQDNFGAFS